MCKFHKTVSLETATNPVSGKLDKGHEALLRVAISHFWLERYVEEAEEIAGYNRFQLASAQGQAAFLASGLAKSPERLVQEKEDGIAYLRARLRALEKSHDFSVEGLNLPRGIKTMALDAFLEKAMEIFFEGDPRDENYRMKDEFDGEAEYRPLFQAVKAFMAEPQTYETVRTLLENSIVTLYTTAPRLRDDWALAAYEALPPTLRKAYNQIADTARDFKEGLATGGATAIFAHSVHYGLMGLAAVGGAAASALSWGGSALAIGVIYEGWNRLAGGQYRPPQDHLTFLALNTAFAVAVGGGLAVAMPHAGHEIYSTAIAMPRETALRNAGMMGMTLDEYARDLCATDPALYERLTALWDADPQTPGIQ